MPGLFLEDRFNNDIVTMRARGGRVMQCADEIVALLQEISGSENALWELVRHESEYRNPCFNCKSINAFVRSGYNISRIRPLFSVANTYRILYAYDNQYDEFFALGVIEKVTAQTIMQATSENNYDYQLDHPFTRSIFDEYDAIGIPRVN